MRPIPCPFSSLGPAPAWRTCLLCSAQLWGSPPTCNTSSICTMAGGTRAWLRVSASSSRTLRAMVSRKCSRASCRTDGSLPCGTGGTGAGAHESLGSPLPWPHEPLPSPLQALHLHRVEHSLQCGEHVTEEEIPGLGQRVQKLLSCGREESALPVAWSTRPKSRSCSASPPAIPPPPLSLL